MKDGIIRDKFVLIIVAYMGSWRSMDSAAASYAAKTAVRVNSG